MFELYTEYISRYLADNYFEEIFSNFVWAKNSVKEHLDIDIDFKKENMDWGKKKIGRKS